MSTSYKFSITNFLRHNLLVTFAILGLIVGVIFTSVTGGENIQKPNQITIPPSSPFTNSISGIGFIEANSRNINIGSFTPGIVNKVNVTEGDSIKKGQVLFILDQRSALAIVKQRKNELEVAKSSLNLAKVTLAEQKDRLTRAKGLRLGVTISEEELKKRHFAVEKAKADIDIKKNLVKQAKTALLLAEVDFDKTIIKSPISGLVLKVRITPGEFISGNERDNNSPMLLGNDKPLYIRVQIDENDTWRFDKNMSAIAFLRSNKNVQTSLTFVRVEPFAQSKENLTGTGKELVDTRIVEIIYKIDSEVKNLFIGQQMDVFIKTDHSF